MVYDTTLYNTLLNIIIHIGTPWNTTLYHTTQRERERESFFANRYLKSMSVLLFVIKQQKEEGKKKICVRIASQSGKISLASRAPAKDGPDDRRSSQTLICGRPAKGEIRIPLCHHDENFEWC